MQFRIIETGDILPAVSIGETQFTNFVDPVVTRQTLQGICKRMGDIEIRDNTIYEFFPDVGGWVQAGQADAEGNFDIRLLSLTYAKV